jgi:hypothetical protein
MQYKSNSSKDLQIEAFKTLLSVLMQKIEAQNELSTPVEASILSLYFVDLCDTKGALGVWGMVFNFGRNFPKFRNFGFLSGHR